MDEPEFSVVVAPLGRRPYDLAVGIVGLVLLVGLALARTGPWLAGPRHLDIRDTWFTLVSMDHLQSVLLDGADWRRGLLGWPLADSAALTDWTAGEALLGLPFRLVGADPVFAHQALVALGLVLTGLVARTFAVWLTGHGPHTWVAAFGAAFHPLHLGHLQHLNLVHHEVALFAVLALIIGLLWDDPRPAFLGALSVGLSAQFGMYMGLHAALLAACVVVAGLVQPLRGEPRKTWVAGRRTWAWLAAGGAVGLGLVAPVVLLYAGVASAHDVGASTDALLAGSWDAGAWLGRGERPTGVASSPGLALGAFGLLGAVLALRRSPLRWVWASLVVAGLLAAVLAMGPELVWKGRATGVPLPAAWLGLSGMREPVRWLAVTWMVLALTGAVAASWLATLAGRRTALLAPLAALLAFGDAAAFTVPTFSQPFAGLPSVYGEAAAIDAPGALFDRALLGPRRGQACSCNRATALRAALVHRRPLAGGDYSRVMPELVHLNKLSNAWPASVAVELFTAIGVGVTIEHGASGQVPSGIAECRQVEGHRLCVLSPAEAPWLPAPDAVRLEARPGDQVVGVRWMVAAEAPPRVRYTCDGEPHTASEMVWRLITRLREPGAEHTDVFFPRSCSAEGGQGTGVPLFAAEDAPAWLPR